MGFRAKLVFLAVLFNLLLVAVVWHLTSGVLTIKKQGQRFVPATHYLQEVSAIQTGITRQMKEALDYLISRKKLDLDQFMLVSQDLEQNFQRWTQAITELHALGGESMHDLPSPDKIQTLYNHWSDTTLKELSVAEKKVSITSLKLFQQNWETLVEAELLPALDETINQGLTQIENNYDSLLLSAGKIPWRTEQNSEQVKKIQASMNVLIKGNRVNASFNTQFAALVNYLISDDETSLNRYYARQTIYEESIKSWVEVIKNKANIEKNPESGASQIADINGIYRRFQRRAVTAIAVKKIGRIQNALDKIVGSTDLLMTDLYDSTSQTIQKEAESLVKRTSSLSLTGIAILVVLLVLSGIFSLQLVNGMLTSLHRLRENMQSIQSGDLERRIELKKNDIIGTLSQTFNSMMDSLCQTQDVLELLTSELEQRVIERTEELADINKDLEAFNSMVSHDLRAPLSAIYGYSQLLLLNSEEPIPPDAVETLVKIVEASESMSRTVAALEALSRANYKQLSREPVELDLLTAKILKNLVESDPQRNVEVLLNPTPNAVGDQGMLEIVLTNLLGNSWKYSSKTPNPKIEFGAQVREGKQVWYIRDNGAGFDMKHADKLFKTFSRLHSDSNFKGTGIGLVTVQRIIQRHGGEIWADAKIGQGATFYFHFG